MKKNYLGINIECNENEFLVNISEMLFGPEINHKEPNPYWIPGANGMVNMFPPEVRYISPFKFDENDEKYALLQTLPEKLASQLNDGEKLHGKFVICYPFESDNVAEVEFSTTAEVLSAIKKTFWQMYACSDRGDFRWGEPTHIIESIRIENLYYDLEKGQFDLFIGS